MANHTVTAGIPGNGSDEQEGFASDLLVKGDSFTQRFSSPGEYSARLLLWCLVTQLMGFILTVAASTVGTMVVYYPHLLKR